MRLSREKRASIDVLVMAQRLHPCFSTGRRTACGTGWKDPHENTLVKRSPYAQFENDALTLRDLLAVDRTIAANERTFLGYVRTTLALIASGGSLLHFVETSWSVPIGIFLIGCSLPMMYVGLRHFLHRRHSLAPLMAAVEETEIDSNTAR